MIKTISRTDKARLQANRLQKSTKQSLAENFSCKSVEDVIRRFRLIGELKTDDESFVLKSLEAFLLSKYLDLVAIEGGFDEWATMRKQLDEQDRGLTCAEDTELYILNTSEFNLNVWCRSYEEAKGYLDTHPEVYLLQYKGQSFLAQAPYIIDLGLDPSDPDWEKIGRDWVKPLDQEAKMRLRETLLRARDNGRS